MTYSVFLVEDEIVTREGIRDAVDWGAAGYHLCGEAPDGEIALPLIRERRPETVITDIKMPFMDGLQLCRILRETLPATKIIILSGHDEFKYAQEAIQLGVAEYLLKPIVPQDLTAALRKVASLIDEERQASAQLDALQAQMASHQAVLRERCLIDLVEGQSSTAQFMEQAQRLGIDLLAPWYQVLVVRVAAPVVAPTPAGLSHACDSLVAAVVGESPAILAFRSAPGQWVLILKGDAPDALAHEAERLAALLRRQALDGTTAIASVGVGPATERLGTIAQSYTQALSQTGVVSRPTPAEHAAQPPDQRHSAVLVAKARSYIDAQYADPEISLHQVAAQVLLSPTYFSVVFAREVGQTFIEYLTNVRIRKAIELLRSSALTASEIGYKVGYQNPRYFYAVFRKVVGQAPTEFRRQA